MRSATSMVRMCKHNAILGFSVRGPGKKVQDRVHLRRVCQGAPVAPRRLNPPSACKLGLPQRRKDPSVLPETGAALSPEWPCW
jgi:hypothetical protein